VIGLAFLVGLSCRLGAGLELRLFSERLSVFRGSKPVSRYDGKLPGAWRLEATELGGRAAILVGVNKRTWNLPFPHRTIFVLGFDGHSVYRRWTGSTMGRPLIDFCVGTGRVFTLERRLDGRVELSSNLWNGFGFRKEARLGHWSRADHLRLGSGGDRLEVEVGWGRYRHTESVGVPRD
jgi:hypothetical protein